MNRWRWVAGLLVLAGCSHSGTSGGSFSGSTAAPTTSSSSTTPPVATPPVSTAPVGISSTLLAGAAVEDVTPPVGVPLAGFGGGARRQLPPDLNPFALDHFLEPSTGVRDPILAHALFMTDGTTPIAFLTLDDVATTASMTETIWAKAQALGSTVPLDNLMVCSSHTHSGPGCLTTQLLWELLAVDLFQDSVYEAYTDGAARALFEAEQNALPAVAGAGSTQVTNATRNRRAGVSPYVTSTSIDPEMLVLRVDRASDGVPIATLWNFAIHGTALGMTSHLLSADIMGGCNADLAQANVGVPLFINSAEGDIAPSFSDSTGVIAGGQVLSDAVLALRPQIATAPSLPIVVTDEQVDFGQPFIDLTLMRSATAMGLSVVQQGWFQVLAALAGQTGVDVDIPMDWADHSFRFQAIRIGKLGFSTVPGEAIHVIGLDMKAFGQSLGFDHTFICGLANGHMSYVTTEPEYWVGGYEGFSTLFGPTTGQNLEAAMQRQLTKVKP